MKTCPKCGAENKPAATECRLCATALDSPAQLPAERLTPPAAAGHQESISQPLAAHTICPLCQAINEPEWVFCMQCGKELPGRGPKAEPALRTPEELITKPSAAVSAQPSEAGPGASPAAAAAAPAAGAKVGGIACRQCGALNSATGFYCASCGALLAAGGEKEAGPARKPVLQLITEGGQVGDVHSLERKETSIGRVDGNFVFPHDSYMSSRHALIVQRDGRYFLVDRKSRNGTFIRIKREVELAPGDMFLVGKQLFRFEK